LKTELKAHLPQHEKPMVEDYVSKWSVEGADKSKYRQKNKKEK